MKVSLVPHRRPPNGYRSRLNREQSRLSMLSIPIISVLLGSMVTALPIITTQAILPPLGLMIFLSWRLLRPGFWPMWSGFPLGLFDDIFSGSPFGSAALIWSLMMIALELIDSRAVWRDYLQDWLVAAIIIALSIVGGWFFLGLSGAKPHLETLAPQIILSIFCYPLIVRLVSRLDSWRLAT